MVEQAITIAKKDLIKPPVLVPSPAVPAVVPAAPVDPSTAKPAGTEEPAKSASVAVEKPVAAVDATKIRNWGVFSASLTGFAALRDIRTFRTYGLGGSLQYMFPAFFSERHRLFGRVLVQKLASENYAYLFVPLYAGLHSTLYQATPNLVFYGELALGVGYLEFTRGDVEKDSWKGSIYLALGTGYFFTPNWSLNIELAGTYITRDQSAGNILRLQLAAVFHL